MGRREGTKARQPRRDPRRRPRLRFAERGYDAVGMRDIVRRTELASGTFYNYFPDKAAVFRAIVENPGAEARAASARLAARRPGGGLPRGRLPRAVRVHRRRSATFAFLRRNLGTIRERFGDAVLPAGLGSRPTCARRSAAASCRRRRRLPLARDARRRARARADARAQRTAGRGGCHRVRNRAVRPGSVGGAGSDATLARHALPPPPRPDHGPARCSPCPPRRRPSDRRHRRETTRRCSRIRCSRS